MAKTLTEQIIAWVKLARSLGYKCEVISAFFIINQGRVSDITMGRIGRNVPSATSLPHNFPPPS